uniref:DEAD domain-containing protein n=1 Tax=Steinernema glaseri TaxID=37863 RepID=A0A1I7YDF4_9BILA
MYRSQWDLTSPALSRNIDLLLRIAPYSVQLPLINKIRDGRSFLFMDRRHGKTFAALVAVAEFGLQCSFMPQDRGPRILMVLPTEDAIHDAAAYLRVILAGTRVKYSTDKDRYQDQVRSDIILGRPRELADLVLQSQFPISALELCIVDAAEVLDSLAMGYIKEIVQCPRYPPPGDHSQFVMIGSENLMRLEFFAHVYCERIEEWKLPE